MLWNFCLSLHEFTIFLIFDFDGSIYIFCYAFDST